MKASYFAASFLTFFLSLFSFEVVGRHGVHAQGLSLVNVLLVSKQTDLVLQLWNMLQLHGSGESLVLLRVVILEANLEVDSLGELPLLLLTVLQDSLDALVQSFTGNFTHGYFSPC